MGGIGGGVRFAVFAIGRFCARLVVFWFLGRLWENVQVETKFEANWLGAVWGGLDWGAFVALI
jgi:hypothetical protein